MSNYSSDDLDLEGRLRRLEAIQSRLTSIGVLALLGLVGFIAACRSLAPDTISARRFVLMGDDGKTLAILEQTKGYGATTPRLSLFGPDGKQNVTLQPIGGLELGGDKGDSGILVASDGVFIRDSAGYDQVTIKGSFGKTGNELSGGGPYIELGTALGHPSLDMAIDNSGDPEVTFFASKGQLAAALRGGSKRRASLTLFDNEGRSRAVLGSVGLKRVKSGVEETLPESSLTFFGEDGSVTFKAPPPR